MNFTAKALAAAALLLAVPSSFAQPSSDCVQYGEMPVTPPPYPTQADLCRASYGKPAPADLTPPSNATPAGNNEYAAKLHKFITGGEYRGLGWIHDLTWRLTGPYKGCQGAPDAENFGVHPAVRIYYSPEVVSWLCGGREGELKPGAMIVKEMDSIEHVAVDSKGLMWLPAEDYPPDNWTVVDKNGPGEWTVMVKSDGASFDGWFWADLSGSPDELTGNPPILGESAIYSETPITKRDPAFYPTGVQFDPNKKSSQVYPFYGFGNYCINCHASAVSESTYSTLDNILSVGVRYKWMGERHPQVQSQAGIHSRTAADAPSVGGFTTPLAQPAPDFLKTFPQLPNKPFDQIARFPAETYDHSVSIGTGKAERQFVTSNQCIGCHDATANRAGTPNMVYQDPGGAQTNLSPYAEWRSSPMGLGGRDPIFFAQLETERNLFQQLGSNYEGPGSLQEAVDCIQNTCLHCHGVMGQRQLEIDTLGTQTRCADLQLIPTKAKTLMTRDIVMDYHGDHAKYGGLARDGISCAVCHHIAGEDLGDEATFTGNFKVGPPDVLYGPYDANVRTTPMEHGLGITPEYGKQIADSALCGSCHAIVLPVYDSKTGKFVKNRFEQTTYLEWLNSALTGESCQDCHMPKTFHNQSLNYKIANIEDSDYPETANRVPDEEIDLQPREFSRHTLYGLNVYLNEMFQQFPMILGVRQLDYMNSTPAAPLLTARDAAVEIAQRETAAVAVQNFSVAGDGTLTADVKVTNLTGHSLPSGVSFRRVFVEFLVLGDAGESSPIWASGRTNGLGVILDGVTDTPLESEFMPGGSPSPPEAGCPEQTWSCEERGNYQVHHQVITSGKQVQIYEELLVTTGNVFTTSFLHRCQTVKDNRLRPRGWTSAGPFAEDTKPEGACTVKDPDYISDGKPLTGSDTIRYQVKLTPRQARRVKQVKATLYSQASPPYYLAQRFSNAQHGPNSEDTQRLYYLTSHLNVDGARTSSGDRFLESWKLPLHSDCRTVTGPCPAE